MILKNDSGYLVPDIPKLIKQEYAKFFDSAGNPNIDWKSFASPYADDKGFDMRYNGINGYFSTINLPKDDIIIRYGNTRGYFTAPLGTPYEQLSLPYIKETIEYHEYKVIADSITVFCIVNKGIVAPNFVSNGGGIQYLHHEPIYKLLRKKILEEKE